MPSYDPELGQQVAAHLDSLGIETPFNKEGLQASHNHRLAVVGNQHSLIMEYLGLDLQNDSLKETPKRVAKMYCEEIFTGLDYSKFPKCSTFDNSMKSNELVVVKNSTVLSMCEHHFVPFIGKAQIAYLPNTKLLGLSKFPRVVDFFSRRPQVQERLTLQIAATLSMILGTEDVAVTLECEHMCMRLRGVKETESSTVTSQMGGRFMSKPELRQEFLNLVK